MEAATARAVDEQILGWLDSQDDAMVELLGSIVNIDSNSYDKAGIDRCGDAISAFFRANALPVSTIPLQAHGDILRVEAPGGRGGRPILILGHRDTVFPTGDAARRPFTIRDGRAHGPGVADMKAGLVVNCFVLAAFARFGGAPAPLVGLVTGDEEIGSPASRPYIEAEARGALAVFNAESARANGDFVVARRGCIFIEIVVEGRSAHSGVNFDDGRSAVEALARKITALYGLTRRDDLVTVNVGQIAGGQSVNTVAANASARVDLRYYEPADRARLLGELASIVEGCDAPGTTARFEIFGEFPPMNETPVSSALADLYRRSAAQAGFETRGVLTAGAADSSFTAAVGAPTLCGLGPVGGRYHSEDEYMEVASLAPRAKALALTIASLGEHFSLESSR
ncbi:MAG: M20 family metallopeptidase [Microvirga sp.]|nr:M20 family metallopeptidase [Microvirga sp.]